MLSKKGWFTVKVNFEFLGTEPMENMITCMNYKIDKVVYLGYNEVIEEQKATTIRFLKRQCGVEKVKFHPLSKRDLYSVVSTMRKLIQEEIDNNNEIFFDITGGESLILVAFGLLSKEFNAPMHLYDIEKDVIMDFSDNGISKMAEPRKIEMTIDLIIQMYGGVINVDKHKKNKVVNTKEFAKDINNIYGVASKHWEYWNPLSSLFRYVMKPDDSLLVNVSSQEVIQAIDKTNNKISTKEMLDRMIDELAAIGILQNVCNTSEKYSFRYKNEIIKECIWEGGSILELHTYQSEKLISKECEVGVHIDWDGVIHPELGVDVLNEIDVLSLKGNILTFMSCKSGNLTGSQALNALYELETVAKRFGGKYAKKILVTRNGLSEVHLERAKEMGIEVRG